MDVGMIADPSHWIFNNRGTTQRDGIVLAKETE